MSDDEQVTTPPPPPPVVAPAVVAPTAETSGSDGTALPWSWQSSDRFTEKAGTSNRSTELQTKEED